MVLERALRDGVLVLTMNRPEQRNALNRDLFREIGQAFVGAETDPEVRAIVLTGAGDKAFCAGMDLKAFAAGEPIGAGDGPGTTVFVERCYPKPIVAAVNGAAVAGGFGVMLGCDIIVAAEHATFGLPEVKRGLVGVGATTRASLRLPPAVTLELALTGEPMDAARALHYGLVNRVVPAADVLPVAIAIGTNPSDRPCRRHGVYRSSSTVQSWESPICRRRSRVASSQRAPASPASYAARGETPSAAAAS